MENDYFALEELAHGLATAAMAAGLSEGDAVDAVASGIAQAWPQ
jgi:uncharacterized protein YoaH (UPF0181 family)